MTTAILRPRHHVVGQLLARLRSSTWAPLCGRAALWLALIVGLAHVGAGTVGRLLGTSVGPPVPERPRLDWRAGTPAPEPTARAPACPEDGSTATAAGCRPITDAGVTDAGDGGAPARTADGRVVLNAATARELRELPGIGEKRAEQILALRDRLGRFRRVEELLQVRGLGPRTLARLKPLVVVDPPR